MLAIVAAPAAASSYSAKLAAPAAGHVVAHEMNWACAGDSCKGTTEDSRPAVLCEGLAKRAGRVDSFVVDGRAFSSAELDKCNAGVRPGPTQAAAAQ
jgi:hypothetical protein